MFHENHGHLGMSTTQCVAHCLVFFGRWSLLRARILHQKLCQNSTIKEKTVVLLLHVLEPIFARGSVVILNSGFCVLKGIVELKKQGVYASALIKKESIGPNTSRVMQSNSILTRKLLVIVTHGRALWRRCPSMYML